MPELQPQNFAAFLDQLGARVDSALDRWLPEERPADSGCLNRAMRYSALAGGKRIRPALCLMVAEAVSGASEAALRAGCAFELIHTYSLIHDDLPAMDDDDLRRGKPTSHKVFGEAAAILAGDALLTLAFSWFADLVNLGMPADRVVKIVNLAAAAAGHQGMVGGQMLDLDYEKKRADLQILEGIHRRKTGALIVAPVLTGAIIAGVSAPDMELLEKYAARIGLLFQIVDDLLDVEGDAGRLGKNTGRDAVLEKSTYPSLLGLEEAKEYARAVHRQALELLNELPVFRPRLAEMADFILFRRS